MTKSQFAITAGVFTLALGIAAILAVVIMSDDPALIGVALLGLGLLSAGILSAGLLGFGLPLHRRIALMRRRTRRLASLCDLQSYS